MLVMSIDQQLREAIDKSGLTRYRIAKDAGVEYDVLRRYLDDGRDLRLSNVEKLAAYFGMKLTTPKRKGTQ
jgi:ribosome-binding protein aMBF1 (putative translation factor)